MAYFTFRVGSRLRIFYPFIYSSTHQLIRELKRDTERPRHRHGTLAQQQQRRLLMLKLRKKFCRQTGGHNGAASSVSRWERYDPRLWVVLVRSFYLFSIFRKKTKKKIDSHYTIVCVPSCCVNDRQRKKGPAIRESKTNNKTGQCARTAGTNS